jgi:leucyl/phenylalanyl-tRNA--protein transferase
MIRIPILRAGVHEPFPPVSSALAEPNGLLAAGGDLSPERLLDAYRHGIFPWFSRDEPILWWSPDPRTVFATDKIHISTKLRRWLRGCDWTIRADSAFIDVMHACAAPRARQRGTWITRAMIDAYAQLHALGHAHSIEVHADDELVGGIYGVAIGRIFFGESMFSARSNGSKIALLALCQGLSAWGFPLLDAQVESAHLTSLGAFALPRDAFSRAVQTHTALPGFVGRWTARWPVVRASDLLGRTP